MTFLGILVAIIPMICSGFSLDLISFAHALISLNLPLFILPTIVLLGSIVSIVGLHEECHCLYCQIKGIRIVGIIGGLKDIGIKVKEPHPPEAPLSSLFSIPITVIVSAITLPLWIVLFNTGVACIHCRDDIKYFLQERKSR